MASVTKQRGFHLLYALELYTFPEFVSEAELRHYV